jgi:hypothetical protein
VSRGSTRMRIRTTSAAVIATTGLALGAPIATAQTSPVQEGYSTPGGVVQTEVENGTPPAPPRDVSDSSTPPAAQQAQQPAASSELPFTGLDVGLVLAAGAMLVVAGFGIRRLSRSTGTA